MFFQATWQHFFNSTSPIKPFLSWECDNESRYSVDWKIRKEFYFLFFIFFSYSSELQKASKSKWKRQTKTAVGSGLFPKFPAPTRQLAATREGGFLMDFLNALWSIWGFFVGISVGLVVGYFLFIYFKPSDVKVCCYRFNRDIWTLVIFVCVDDVAGTWD